MEYLIETFKYFYRKCLTFSREAEERPIVLETLTFTTLSAEEHAILILS
jgi:hypothetical protein